MRCSFDSFDSTNDFVCLTPLTPGSPDLLTVRLVVRRISMCSFHERVNHVIAQVSDQLNELQHESQVRLFDLKFFCILRKLLAKWLTFCELFNTKHNSAWREEKKLY